MDVPAVDTLLLLRPTDSPTLFLQQLGRGLRRSPGKSGAPSWISWAATDGVPLRAALPCPPRRQPEGPRSSRSRGIPVPAAGCHMELDRVAPRSCCATSGRPSPLAGRRRSRSCGHIARGEATIRLARFLDETGLDLEDVYTGQKTWSDSAPTRACPVAPEDPRRALRRACGRMLHVDDTGRIEPIVGSWRSPSPPRPRRLSVRDRRLLRMLVASVVDKAVTKAIASRTVRPPLGSTRRYASSSELFEVLASRLAAPASCSRLHRTCRSGCTRATPGSRSWLLSAWVTAPRSALADGRLLGKEAERICSRSRSTRPAASFRRRRATATTPSAAS